MKRNVVLISNFGGNLTDGDATGETIAGRPQNTFDIIRLALEEVDVAIVDLGTNLQSLAIVEALTHTTPAPPVIALIDEKDANTTPELQRAGAAACLKKPFCADELARLIEAVCAPASRGRCPSCDKWGHLCVCSPPS